MRGRLARAVLAVAVLGMTACTATIAGHGAVGGVPSGPQSSARPSPSPSPTVTPLPAPAGVTGHRDDCPAFWRHRLALESQIESITMSQYTCLDRVPTGLISITDDHARQASDETEVQQLCSLVPDATAQRLIGPFQVVVLNDSSDPSGPECDFWFTYGKLSGLVRSKAIGTSSDLVQSFCVGSFSRSADSAAIPVTIAGIHGSREGSPTLGYVDQGFAQLWQYRLPVPIPGGALCLISEVSLSEQPGAFDLPPHVSSPSPWAHRGLRLVTALATALKDKAH